MDEIEHCQRAVDAAAEMIGVVTDADLGRATPCAGWDVGALIAHMVWICEVYADGLSGGTPPAAASDLGRHDPAASYGEASGRAMVAWRAGVEPDQMLALPFGTLPVALGVWVFIGDQLIHTWDLATALGRDFTMPAEIAAQQLELMKQHYNPEARGADRPFGVATECPPDASVQDQLIALSGRQLAR